MNPDQDKSAPTFIAYLPLRDGHVVPIRDLHPDAIKAAVDGMIVDPGKPIKRTAALSAVTQCLGFKGGFNGYKDDWRTLDRFLRSNGCTRRVDLLAPPPDAWAPLRLARRSVADRLFHSTLDLPERIFTGHDFDWPSWDHRAELRLEVAASFNLLSDALVAPRRDDQLVRDTWFERGVPALRVEAAARAETAAFRRFQGTIDRDLRGWVDVIPYNGSLVFLRGRDGAYDFVFRGLRDGPPPPPPFDGALTPDDVPNEFYANAVFERWDYFQSGRWEDRDSWEAETAYYAAGGTASRYPGTVDVRRSWAATQGRGRTPSLAAERGALPGWTTVTIDGARALCVSPLVTIGELRSFLAESGYEDRREEKTDDLAAPNHDPPEMPACVNWYDALAYAREIERRSGRPVRLLRAAEYRQLHPGALPPVAPPVGVTFHSTEQARLALGCVEFVQPDGSRRQEWGWIGTKEQARFRPDLTWREGRGGIRFLVSPGFGEWLFEHVGANAAAVHAATLRAIHDGFEVERDLFPASSWGKYRCCKIGFRLCFDLDDPTTPAEGMVAR